MLKDSICLTIPRKAEYVSIVRLASSGMANNINLNIDEIEDIKVCVGEACNNALNLSKSNEIKVEFSVLDEKITISVSDVMEDIPEDVEGFKEGELGILIIKSLMDEVEFSQDGIEMIKYIE